MTDQDHAAEVKRLTAERDNLRKEAEIQAQEARTQSHTVRECYAAVGANHRGDWHGAQPIRDKINALTARVAELEASIEKFGSCIFNTRGDLEHVELGTDQLNALMAEFVRHFPSPLPTAGDEAPKVSEPGNPGPPPPGYRGAYVPESIKQPVPCSCGRKDCKRDERSGSRDHLCPDCGKVQFMQPGEYADELKASGGWCDCDPAPAEPDSPAEERPTKLRDESWVREAADAEDQHASVCAGNMPPRKPACLDGVPAVLCECSSGRRWAYGPISNKAARNIATHCPETDTVWLQSVQMLTPIHHDPTDAAAVELAARIAEGGNRG